MADSVEEREQVQDTIEGFWLRRAKELVEWYEEPATSLTWDPPHCTWFADGEVLGDTTTLRDPAVVEQLKHEADRMLGRGGS
jgi:hypothetical protein